MANANWLDVPVGPDAEQWATVRTERTALVVVHTVAAAASLINVAELIERDQRVQTVYTSAPDLFANGVADLLRNLGGVVAPWRQAITTTFDLVVAADCAGIHKLRGPVLLLPHGVPNNKVAPEPLGGAASGLVVGLSAPWLTWYGRLVPASVALPHVDLRRVLAHQCPQAVPLSTVTGDLCLDRLAVARTGRLRYRRALGVGDRQILVMVSSTWGPYSLFGRFHDQFDRLLAGLGRDRYAVIGALHPALWHGHGPRQVMAWCHELRRHGLRLVGPLDWAAVAAAADVVVGDHGSATLYAAAAGVPVLRMPSAPDSVGAGSAVAVLNTSAPVMSASRPLAHQLDCAIDAFGSGASAAIARRITSEPGRAATLLRAELYRLMRLPEPSALAGTVPPPVASRLVD